MAIWNMEVTRIPVANAIKYNSNAICKRFGIILIFSFDMTAAQGASDIFYDRWIMYLILSSDYKINCLLFRGITRDLIIR